MNNTIKLILVFFLAVVVGFGVVILIKKPNGEDAPPVLPPIIETDTVQVPGPTPVPFDSVTKVDIPITPVAPKLVTNKVWVALYVGKISYSYTVSGIKVNVDSGNIIYTLADSFGHKYTSNDGKFTNVKANSTGTYTVVAEDTATGLSSEPKFITGFKEIVPIASPLTASELTNMIITGDYDGNKSKLNGKLAKSLSVKCSNPDYTANTIQEVFMSVLLENWIITITSLEYNCLKQVTRINLSAHK